MANAPFYDMFFQRELLEIAGLPKLKNKQTASTARVVHLHIHAQDVRGIILAINSLLWTGALSCRKETNLVQRERER